MVSPTAGEQRAGLADLNTPLWDLVPGGSPHRRGRGVAPISGGTKISGPGYSNSTGPQRR
jgi:hypothetical protein